LLIENYWEDCVGTHLIAAFNVLDGVNKAMADWIEKAVAGHSLTALEFRALDGMANGAINSASRCSRYLNIMPTKASLIMEKLERCGYVQRRRDRPDRRLIVLQLTDEGLEAYELALKSLTEEWAGVLSNVGADVMQMIKLFTGPFITPVGELIEKSLQVADSAA
jgi:DNA-binding MarR family transcriptional regulator